MHCMAHPGETIRRWMDARSYSEGHVARLSGVKQPTIHRILTGESKDPRRSNLERIAAAFGATVDDLYSDTAQPGEPTLDSRATEFAVLVSGLTDEQIDIIYRTAVEFRKTS